MSGTIASYATQADLATLRTWKETFDMGMELRLEDEKGRPILVHRHYVGSVLTQGGEQYADCSITYNYFAHFKAAGLYWDQWNRRLASEALPSLKAAIVALGDDPPTNDYWEGTPGNARAILEQILPWFERNPSALIRLSF